MLAGISAGAINPGPLFLLFTLLQIMVIMMFEGGVFFAFLFGDKYDIILQTMS